MEKSESVYSSDISHIEEISPGLHFQWLFNHRAIAFYAEHTSRELVDAWANKIIEIRTTWPVDRPLFILNDFSCKDCVSTPYNQQKNRELMRMFPGAKAFTAVVVKQNLTMQLSRIFIRALPNSKNILLSFSQEEALSWLKKHLDEDERRRTQA